MAERNPLKRLFEWEAGFESIQGDNPYFSLIARELVQRFCPGVALDIGCYMGQLVYALRQLGVDAHGVDISEAAISHCVESVRAYLRQVDVDFEPLPFNDKTFDLVIAHQVLQHLQRPGYVISEMWRVLKTGGTVFIMTPTPPFEASWWSIVKIQHDPEHINNHSRATWIKIFELNGFRYIGNLRRIVQKAARRNLDPPSYWLGCLLRRMGAPGRWFWGQLAGYVRGTCLFEARQFHPDAAKLVGLSAMQTKNGAEMNSTRKTSLP